MTFGWNCCMDSSLFSENFIVLSLDLIKKSYVSAIAQEVKVEIK